MEPYREKIKKYKLETIFTSVFNDVNIVFNNTIPNEIIELFSNKTYMHRWYENSNILNWRSTIIDRIFNPNKNESANIIYENSYSELNPYFIDPIVTSFSKNFIDAKYNRIRFRYIIYGNGGFIHFIVNVEDCTLDDFDISLTFLVDDKIYHVHETSIIITKEECIYRKRKIYSHILIEEMRNDLIKTREKDAIKIKIPLEMVCCIKSEKYCFKVQLIENIQDVIKMSIDEIGHDDSTPKIIKI